MDTSDASRTRALVPLLTAIAVLLAILVVGLGVGAIAALRAVHAARAEVARLTGRGGEADDARGQVADARRQVKDLGADLVQRQQLVARQLTSESAAAEQKLRTFQNRLQQLYPIRQGATPKVDQTIALMQLMNDQMILMNHQVSSLQTVAARALRPLDAERAVAEPDRQTGTGGSGTPGRPDGVPGGSNESGIRR